MTAHVGTSAGGRELIGASIGTASGVRAVQEIWIGTASGARLAWAAALTAAITPTAIAALITGGGAATTSAVTASASGGAGPYSYAWARISGDTRVSAVSPAAAATTFTATLNVTDTAVATFRVTATDAGTAATGTADIVVTLESLSGA